MRQHFCGRDVEYADGSRQVCGKNDGNGDCAICEACYATSTSDSDPRDTGRLDNTKITVGGVQYWHVNGMWNRRADDGTWRILAEQVPAFELIVEQQRALAHLASERDNRQRAVLAWTEETFGALATAQRERADRFIEEAIELVQACGVDVATVHHFVDLVYARPAGDPKKEIGQVGLMLLSLAQQLGVSADEREHAEFERVRAIPASEWKRRRDVKIKDGRARSDVVTHESSLDHE